MNDECFRLSLIDIMHAGLLNDFVNLIFDYNLKNDEEVYIQYKIASGNIILNIFDNCNNNRFNGYIFSNNNFIDNKNSITCIDVNETYRKYKNGTSNKNIILIGALLKSNDENEKVHIINLLFDGKMKEIISKNFL